MDEESVKYKIPLGLCKQAFMKLESFSSDIREIIEEEDLDPIDRENFEKMVEISGFMMANIINIIKKECGEDEFISEEIDMDPIDPYPGEEIDIDILNQEA